MKPYYEHGGVTIYHGDCRDMGGAWTAADVLLTDPPYGMAFVSSKTTQTRPIANDDSTDARDAALSMWGAEKPAAVFGTWKRPRPNGTRNVLIWDKGDSPGMGDLDETWGNSAEECYILGSWPRTVRRMPQVIRTYQMLSGASGLAKTVGHPTPKPVALLEHILRVAPSGCVADPFMGSGSTLVAAKNLGRRAVGVEIEERYCEIAARRLSQEVLDFGGAA